jgi:hypothetical protein
MLRKSIVVATAITSIAVLGAPAGAKDTDKGKWSQDKAQGYCNAKEGSTFWSTPDGNDYGCGYKGGGGLMCDKQNGCLESDGKAERRETPMGLLGLLGLAGAIGLAGVKRRGDEPVR